MKTLEHSKWLMWKVLGRSTICCQWGLYHCLERPHYPMWNMPESHKAGRAYIASSRYKVVFVICSLFCHSSKTGKSTYVLRVDLGGGKGLDLSQNAIKAIDTNWAM